MGTYPGFEVAKTFIVHGFWGAHGRWISRRGFSPTQRIRSGGVESSVDS